jgi:hypothetical protein
VSQVSRSPKTPDPKLIDSTDEKENKKIRLLIGDPTLLKMPDRREKSADRLRSRYPKCQLIVSDRSRTENRNNMHPTFIIVLVTRLNQYFLERRNIRASFPDLLI